MLPRPTPMLAVAHSPTPSSVRIAASSNGDGKERAGRVRLVVLGEDVSACCSAVEASPDLARQVQLLLQPDGMRHEERPEAARRERQIGLEQALELQQRLVVEPDVVELGRRRCRASLQAVVDRLRGKSASCFLRVKRSSCAAATISPSTTRAAAQSW